MKLKSHISNSLINIYIYMYVCMKLKVIFFPTPHPPKKEKTVVHKWLDEADQNMLMLIMRIICRYLTNQNGSWKSFCSIFQNTLLRYMSC